jgi:hypothetical protein
VDIKKIIVNAKEKSPRWRAFGGCWYGYSLSALCASRCALADKQWGLVVLPLLSDL